MEKLMRIVCISDTHGRHKKIKDIPEGDVLIHAGDITPSGQLDMLGSFNKWLGKLPHPNKIIVAGNHDWCFTKEYRLIAKEMVTNATYLEDSEIIIDGVKFYGSPWQPEFCNWAFNLPRGEELAEIWSHIPDDTNVLITHAPPYGLLDLVINERSNENGEQVGCIDLGERIFALKKLKLHVFGHIHCAHGEIYKDGIHYVNASTCTEAYMADNEPIVVDI